MSKMSSNDKATRVLRFLLGARDNRVATALQRYGFTPDDLREGWHLLYQAGGAPRASWTAADTEETLGELDEWENEWFPVVSASLERHHPDVHALVFDNLSQATGARVVVTVRTLLDRIEQMRTGAGAYAANGPEAMKTLAKRGLDDAVLAEARSLLERLEVVATNHAGATAAEAQATEKAEAALWAWYLEWSRIARIAIDSRALLRRLGFLQGREYAPADTNEASDAATAPAPAVNGAA